MSAVVVRMPRVRTPEQVARRAECARQWRAQNPKTAEEKRIDAARSRAYASSEAGKAVRAAYRAAVKSQERDYRRRKQYGLSPETFAVLLETQNGRCAICRIALDASSANVDHDHNTGRVRGLLCRKDNLAIGLMADDAERLSAAAAYLKRSDS